MVGRDPVPGGGRRFGGTRFNFSGVTSNFDQGYKFYDTNFKINLDPDGFRQGFTQRLSGAGQHSI